MMHHYLRRGWSGKRRSDKAAFTLIEVLVVVAIIALLVSILLPSLARAREQSRRAVCATRLHNIGLTMMTYANMNKGKIIECASQDPTSRDSSPDTQVVVRPRMVAPGGGSASTAPRAYVDWHAAAKKLQLDRQTWECPNREGIFGYEGDPSVGVQGYTAQHLRSLGYKVTTEGVGGMQQWVLGYQYFGGIKKWNPVPLYSGTYMKSASPVDDNAKPHWALAADSVLRVAVGWGGDRPSCYANIPPHPDGRGRPEGANVLTFDGAVGWHHASKLYAIHSWRSDRIGFWHQTDLGEYGDELRKDGRRAPTADKYN